MISKKNKGLVAALLAAATTATAVMPSMASAATEEAAKCNDNYKEMFASLYDDVITNGQDNGYLSKQNNGGDSFGIPYHAVETLVVEAPDYGHETTSEAMSYIVWMAAMHDVLLGGSDLPKAWTTLEAMIPGWSKASGRSTDVNYKSIWSQDRLKADTAPEKDEPSGYPTQNAGMDAINPLYSAYKTAYGSDNGYYLMNWLADVDDWYGFGGATPGAGNGKFTFINTFQRGEQESCFETVPQPCIEELKYGNPQDGIKGIFNGSNVPKQYSFTNAPDAEDRAIQAVYFANKHGAGDKNLSALAGKMGDQCRNDMFDKYYHAIGCQDIMADGTTKQLGEAGGQHYLMSWYTAWGGALDQYNWAWQIGCSHSHQFYQNPLAAYALLYDSDINEGMKASGATGDYEKSLKRQIEMYLWLQSKDGLFAGGCTNSYRGRYEKYPDGYPTFYKMVYVPHPVYADPGSNHWIGNQVWSMQRLAELYYYVKKDGDKTGGMTFGGLSLEDALKTLIERWVAWFEKNTKFNVADDQGNIMSYAIPSTVDWGKNDTDYSVAPDTWTGTYNPNGNQNLTCEIKGYGQGDVGCVSSLCNTLIYYAAAEGVDASCAQAEKANGTTAEKGLYLANKLLSAQWNEGRDGIGISFTDHNGSLKRLFTEKVYIPSSYSGTMPDGSKLDGNATFSSIRGIYEQDPMYAACKKVYEETGATDTYTYKLHRFWHAGDALMAYGGMALLYPEVKPLPDEDEELKVTLWGDANCDGEVNMADAVLIMQSLSNPDVYGEGKPDGITKQGMVNGDVYDNGDGITVNDASSIQSFKLELIDKLPESYKA